ncbi:uncharacterized protein isoform X2 [Salmo salar]|uniref:Uncharacterized protein isoform X2 n=1 Tax=Salmo salar TaxID=8030 RepID=A0ABM3DSI4_SALSA|nr:uncharacterized protein LOC123729720 isoform X2 [Salmo salar]
MTDEIGDIFVGLGSSIIKDVKFRDSWVFAGGSGTKEKSPFDKPQPMLACCRTEMESRVRVKVQRTRRAQEGRWTTTSARESGSEGVSDLIIQLKKPLNPVRVSKSHQELHRELRMTHKTWGLHKRSMSGGEARAPACSGTEELGTGERQRRRIRTGSLSNRNCSRGIRG